MRTPVLCIVLACATTAAAASVPLASTESSLISEPRLPSGQPPIRRHDHGHHADEDTNSSHERPAASVEAEVSPTLVQAEGGSAPPSATALVPNGHDAHVKSHEHAEHGTGHDHHHSREPPKLVLDEADILRTHSPDPPSYFDYDGGEDGKRWLLVGHVVTMVVAFFGFLPLAIFLRSGRSPLAILPQTAFLAVSILGLCLGRIYNAATPQMYEGSSHSGWGWATMLLAIGLNLFDVVRFVATFTRFSDRVQLFASRFDSRLGGGETERSLFKLEEDEDVGCERTALVSSPIEEPGVGTFSGSSSRGSSFSDADTVYDSAGPESSALVDAKGRRSRLRRLLSGLHNFSTRFLVILGYIELCTGIAVYTGTCRGNYLNGCLAHLIKGSIFFWYGLLTFARFCGGMSTYGWAWNRHPSRPTSIWTAEFVESLVIFVYGATNTWMERFGKTGAISVKDAQHIGIAIMFWAAGALGMLMESRTVRSWLATPAIEASGQTGDRVAPPASAAFSFNPFPALVIGVTGVAMSAHHQTYMFQVEIHALWGYLLAAFAVFRFLTYFFLYLRPPASILPSRPPTEALASLFLTCGGIVFVFSTEQITFAAMRHQADDMMAFGNVAFAFASTCFLWIIVLFGVKGWALKRNPLVAPDRFVHTKPPHSA
ncbi:hypothetical protein JCM10212_001487 [Sporobolomyces blumeae]